MNMIPVSSSNISSIGYENGTLYVHFYKGGTYAYSNVPESVFNSLMNASSHGKFLKQHIEKSYPYRKIN